MAKATKDQIEKLLNLEIITPDEVADIDKETATQMLAAHDEQKAEGQGTPRQKPMHVRRPRRHGHG